MGDLAQAAWNTVELSKRHILEQQARVARQRALVTRLDDGAHPGLCDEARRFLRRSEDALAQMTADHVAASERLAHETVDENSLRNVERDCPM